MTNEKLAKNAEFDNAIDVFKYRGKNYPKDMEMGWKVPAKGEDYEHVCRFPHDKTKAFFSNHYRGLFGMGAISAIIGARSPEIKRFKEKYCTSRVSRLREPDMVCLPNRGWQDAECRFLHEEPWEVQAEMGAKYTWDSPYYATHKYKIVPDPWRAVVIGGD